MKTMWKITFGLFAIGIGLTFGIPILILLVTGIMAWFDTFGL